MQVCTDGEVRMKIQPEQIRAFLKKHPAPKDILVHHFAQAHGWKVDKVEEAIYKIAGEKYK